MSIKKAIQLTAVLATLAADHYLGDAVPINTKLAQVSTNILTYEDELEEDDDCGEGGFNSEFKDVLSPLNRVVVPAWVMDTSDFCEEDDAEEEE